ncbi:MAG: Serine/threonine-protein kinase StkP [Chloroflexi bacterium ADurb.Bin360]|nr:MAG: Serine/threonine-protein kinase StkP [Chloroflexi bacterium ADurb.Bin360]
MLGSGQLLQHGRYRIDALLGQGGMGAVYRAWDASLEMPVAIKENLDTSAEAQKQFSREARLLAQLSHPHLPRVIDYFFIPQQGQYLVMDYIAGEDLESMVQRLGPLPEAYVLPWLMQICDALNYLHSQPAPIIHRDVKPANIKIRPDGQAMLVDFGIAKIYDPVLSTTIGAKAITPGYNPPEQYGDGNTDARSDVYALGATLYHVLTGQRPPESVRRMVEAIPLPTPRQLNPRISPLVEQSILRATEVATSQRFQSVAALRAALSGTGAPVTPGVTRVTGGNAAPAPQPRWFIPALVIGVIALLALTGLGLSALLKGGGREAVATPAAPSATPVVAAVVKATLAPEATPTSPLSATLAIAPVPEITLTLETTSPPLATPLPTATSVPRATSTPACPPVSGTFAGAWATVQGEIGCAQGNAYSGLIAEENFERGKMFWREPVDYAQALVLFNNGTWRIFQHSPYVEGSPDFTCPDANTPAQCPPTPRRGFGMMWCNISEIRSGLGNATDCERGYQGTMQTFDRGFMVRSDSGATYVFYNDGSWARR